MLLFKTSLNIITFAKETQGYTDPGGDLAEITEAGEAGLGGEAGLEAGKEAGAPAETVLDEAEAPPLPGDPGRGGEHGGHQAAHNQHLNTRLQCWVT